MQTRSTLTHPAALLREARALRTSVPEWTGGVLPPSAPVEHQAALHADAAAVNLTAARTCLRQLLIRTRSRDARFLQHEYGGDWTNLRKQARGAIRMAAADLGKARALLAPAAKVAA
jgi:hypothetical protein